MSFKDDYKNQIESLSADGYLKEKILKKIEEKEKKSFNFFSFKSLAVATLCLILAAQYCKNFLPHLTYRAALGIIPTWL